MANEEQQIDGLDPEYQEEVAQRLQEGGKALSFDPTSIPIDIDSNTFHSVGKEMSVGIRLGLNELYSQAQAQDLERETIRTASSIFVEEITKGCSQGQLGQAIQDKGDDIFRELAQFALRKAEQQMSGLQNST